MNKKILLPIVLVVIILIIAGIFIITKKDNKLVTSPLPPQNSIVVTDPEVISLFDEVIAELEGGDAIGCEKCGNKYIRKKKAKVQKSEE